MSLKEIHEKIDFLARPWFTGEYPTEPEHLKTMLKIQAGLLEQISRDLNEYANAGAPNAPELIDDIQSDIIRALVNVHFFTENRKV
jgi:hypothetical protein